MAGHAQLKFVMTECSKTQIRLAGLISRLMPNTSGKRHHTKHVVEPAHEKRIFITQAYAQTLREHIRAHKAALYINQSIFSWISNTNYNF